MFGVVCFLGGLLFVVGRSALVVFIFFFRSWSMLVVRCWLFVVCCLLVVVC